MQISLVVAAALNNAIGKEGVLPWHLPSDLKHFKNVTWGLPVIMGRKSFDSLGKPLPGRTNIVLSKQNKGVLDSTEIIRVQTPAAALEAAASCKVKEAMVIGGGEIYQLFWKQASRIYLTRVDCHLEADTFFPVIDPNDWKLVQQVDREANIKNSYNHSFQIWERIS